MVVMALDGDSGFVSMVVVVMHFQKWCCLVTVVAVMVYGNGDGV